jgi:hypothetical protein
MSEQLEKLINEVVDKPVVITLKKTCAACPSQWEGKTADNRQIYYRFRWGGLTVTVSEPNDEKEYAAVRGKEVFYAELSDGLDGVLSTNDMFAITKKKIKYELSDDNLAELQKYEDDDAENQWF